MESEKKRCACCTHKVSIGILLGLGVFFVVLGALAFPLLRDLFHAEVKKQIVLTDPSSEAYKNWVQPPVPSYMQMNVFSYMNPGDILEGAKPIVTEMGPYSYREVRENVVLARDDYEITYLENYTYIFDPETSCANCTEDDYVITPNVAVLAIINQTRNVNKVLRLALSVFMWVEKVPLFYNHTVRQLIWGYEDGFLAKLAKAEGVLKPFVKNLPEISPFVAIKYNGTVGAVLAGNLTIDTGKRNVDDIQRILRWRNLTTAPFWNGSYAEMINGTDGTHFAPFLDKTSKLYLFVTDIGRSLWVDFDSERMVEGIKLWRYTTREFLFGNVTENPDNWEFCVPRCYESGLLAVGQLQSGNPPVFASPPHFYQSYPGLAESISGLSPEKSKHATFVDVEPTTGILMEGHKRLQLNVLAEAIEEINLVKNLRGGRIYLPILYFHEVAVIDKVNADKFKKMVYLGEDLMKAATYGLLALGGLLILCGLFVGLVPRRPSNYLPINESESRKSDPIS